MDPKAGFTIAGCGSLSNEQRAALDLLYQPLIHSDATALLHLLGRLSEVSHHQGQPYQQHPLSDLLTLLSISGQALVQACDRLEGVGLLRTYRHQDQNQSLYIFQLVAPLKPSAFYRDDLLSIGLLETVGETLYQSLNQRLVDLPLEISDKFQNITKNFLDVFTVNQNDVTHLPKVIQNLRPHVSKNQPAAPHDVNNHEFDFKFLLEILNNTYVDLGQVKKQQRLILTEHTLYGIDETAMAHFIERATSVTNNQTNFKHLKFIISHAYQTASRPRPQATSSVKTTPSKQPSSSGEVQTLLQVAKTYAPVEFLKALRQQLYHQGITTRKDINVIRHVLNYGAFRENSAVVNIMIYYATIDQQMTTLSANFMDALVTAWTAAQVQTPEDALSEIKKFKRSKQSRWNQYTKQKYHRRPHPQREKMPEWSKQKPGSKPLKKTSRALQRDIQARLKRLGEKH